MSLTRVQAQAIVDKLKAHIAAITDPVFELIVVGQPTQLPIADRAAYLWYEGSSIKFQTLADNNVAEHFKLVFLWRPQTVSELTERIEVEAWISSRAIQERLHNDIKLTGSAQKVELSDDDIEVGWIRISEIAVRAVIVPIKLWIYETDQIIVTP